MEVALRHAAGRPARLATVDSMEALADEREITRSDRSLRPCCTRALLHVWSSLLLIDCGGLMTPHPESDGAPDVEPDHPDGPPARWGVHSRDGAGHLVPGRES